MKRILLAIAAWCERRAGTRHEPHEPRCWNCHKLKGKRDKFTTLAWKHDDCHDPTLAAAESLPEPLRTVVLTPVDERERV